MKKYVLPGAMLLLLAGAVTLGVFWALDATELAGYAEEYGDVAGQVVVIDLPMETDALPDDAPLIGELSPPDDAAEGTQPEPAPSVSAAGQDGRQSAASERVAVDFDELLRMNGDTVGWLYIPGTKVNYPVVQASDNEYYLTRSFKGNAAKCGTLFLDFQNSVNPLDRNTIIFGHNMGSSSSLMFSTLTKYKKESYLNRHPTLQFDTPYLPGQWRIFAVCHVAAPQIKEYGLLRQDFISDAEFSALAAALQALSLYETDVSIPVGGRILTLVTCDRSNGYGEEGRLLVAAVRTN